MCTTFAFQPSTANRVSHLAGMNPYTMKKKIVCILWTQSMWENLWNNKHVSDSLLWYRFHCTLIHRFHCTYPNTQVSLHLLWYTCFTALIPIHRFHCTYSGAQVSQHLLQYTGFTVLTPINMFHCTYSHTQVSLHLLPYTGFTALTLIHMFHCTYSNT